MAAAFLSLNQGAGAVAGPCVILEKESSHGGRESFSCDCRSQILPFVVREAVRHGGRTPVFLDSSLVGCLQGRGGERLRRARGWKVGEWEQAGSTAHRRMQESWKCSAGNFAPEEDLEDVEDDFSKFFIEMIAFLRWLPREAAMIKWPSLRDLVTVASITMAVVVVMIIFLSSIDQVCYWLLARTLRRAA